MNGIELLRQVLQCVSVETLLNTFKNRSERGNVFEKIWLIVTVFGYCSLFPNSEYDYYEGNANTCRLKKVPDIEDFLKNIKVFSKGKGGSSDITVQQRMTGKWVFGSSKYYENDMKKKADNYDVEKLLAITNKHKNQYPNHEFVLFVRNKQAVLKVFKSSQSTNKYITEQITERNILDLNDLEIAVQRLKVALQGIPFEEYNRRFYTLNIPVNLRFHQDLITAEMLELVKNGHKNLLLGAKARSGKTYTIGGLIIKHRRDFGKVNALIITPAPTETMTQFTDDLFHKFRDFSGINVSEIKQGRDLKGLVLNPENSNVIIVSKQLLDDYVLDKTVMAIRNLDLDYIIFDENHFHGTTEMAKHILDAYSSAKTVRVYLTATFMKPLNEWNIAENCRFYWDLEDEKMCKNRDVRGLTEKHGPVVEKFLTEQNMGILLEPYDRMPDLKIISTLPDAERWADIMKRINHTCYGFSNTALLSGSFNAEVDLVLRYITGSNKLEDFSKGDKSIYGRIRKISTKHKSRTNLNNRDFTTQLWFLPYGAGMKISGVSEYLKSRMAENTVLRDYEIKIVNSTQKEYRCDDLKNQIAEWETNAKAEGKTGLILLAGNQMTLGITLPMVDIVFLLNDTTSGDKIVQMMYRCMTEGLPNKLNSGTKKMGFVVDLNISRVLQTALDFPIHNRDLNTEQKLAYLVENELFDIDADIFQSQENKKDLVKRLLEIWKACPVNHLKTLLRKIEEEILELDGTDQQMLNQHFTRSADKDGKIQIEIKMDDESPEGGAPTGVSITRDAPVVNEDNSVDEYEEEEETVIQISLTKDVLPYVIPLICILTMNTPNRDILEMLNVVRENPTLLSVFEDQSFIWWNRHDVIKLIGTIIQKYVKKKSVIYNIAIQFKLSLQSLIDRPKELLELIDSCLKPKQKEKQENGEVFTPMPIIDEMLDQLDKHYVAENGRSIFTEKELKWFDPASGMGNFPVAVYLRLMKGLQQGFVDEQERKRHIIENMLYMSELNKKNVFISHQIFNADGKYKINLNEGDTLELNVKQKWGINNFDVVLGNPPYNKGGIRSHTGKQLGEKNETIWTKFIEKSLEWLKQNGFLAFINPLSWLKKSHSLHNRLLEKHIVWLKLWDNSQSKTTINADIPISLFVLQKTENVSNKKTEILSVLKRRNLTTTSKEYLNEKYSISLAFHSIFNKLSNFIETNILRLEYKTKTVKSIGTKLKIPLTYTSEDMWAVDTFTLKDGLMVKKATEQHPDANKRKLIISNKASFSGAFIDDGKLGLTGNHKFYVLGDNLELVKKMLDFKIINLVGHYTKYGQDFLDNEAFAYIPDIRKLGITDITEDKFYELIGLTAGEILQIKTTEKN